MAISAVVLIGAFLVVPWDLPANASLSYHVVARLLELCYVCLGISGVICLFYGLVKADTSYVVGGVVLVVLTVAALLGQIFSFPLVVTSLGQIGLIGLLVVAVILAIISIPTQSSRGAWT